MAEKKTFVTVNTTKEIRKLLKLMAANSDMSIADMLAKIVTEANEKQETV